MARRRHRAGVRDPELSRGAQRKFEVIKKFKPLRESPEAVLQCNIVKGNKGEPRLDIRLHLMSGKWAGPTKKGINIGYEEWQLLMKRRKKIERYLSGEE